MCRFVPALSLCLTGLALVPAPAAANNDESATEVVLRGISKWDLTWTNNACSIEREFGSEQDKLLVRINKFQLNDSIEFVVSGRQLTPFRGETEIHVTYGRDGKPETARPMAAESDLFGPALILSKGLSANQDNIDRIILTKSGHRIVLGTGPLHPVLAALRNCTDDRYKARGLDPDAMRRLSRPPAVVDIMALVRAIQQHYPQPHTGKQARVGVMAMINAEGAVTDCEVPLSYNDPEFDKAACKRTMAARFKPALDAQGKPVAAYYTFLVVYRQ